LFHYLKQHPEIGMLESKDANYFVDFRVKVKDLQEYEALFSGFADRRAIGEAPVRALYDEEAIRKIHSTLPGVKILVILRNPAAMAHSLWGHMVRNGERLSFKRALKVEPRRMADPMFRKTCNNWHGDYYYFHRGLYFEQIKRCFDTFGRENVRVHLFDDLATNPLQTCRACFAFLGVDSAYAPVMDKHNVGKVYRHRGLHKLLNQPPRWLVSMENGLMGGLVHSARLKLMKVNTRRVPPLDPMLRKRLLEKYRPDIEKLSDLLNRDLSHWQ
jgi:hypothetical protein